MKFYNLLLCSSFSVLMSALVGCQNNNIDEEHHYDNTVYVTTKAITDDLLIKESISEASRSIAYRLAAPAPEDVVVSFDAKPQMAAAYNLAFNDNAEALQPDYFELPSKSVIIKAGDISSEDIVINFKNTNQLDKSKRYVLPVSIVDANIGILKSKQTAYFIFKGAALINVVANIANMYFPINWKSNVSSLKTITVEALVRSNDWVAGRDNALSTVFGIEGRFLIRIGDSDRPRDQLQCVASGGNFPAPNAVSGLPVNEWVHIAIVYDSSTGERIYYKDGVKVYSDDAAGGSVNLNGDCYIGRAYDDSRWLPGEISEVRIWSVQRTAEEIAKNPYEVNPASPGLIAYWKFNEGTGSQIKDHTGHGNDITATGSPIWIPVEIPKLN